MISKKMLSINSQYGRKSIPYAIAHNKAPYIVFSTYYTGLINWAFHLLPLKSLNKNMYSKHHNASSDRNFYCYSNDTNSVRSALKRAIKEEHFVQ